MADHKAEHKIEHLPIERHDTWWVSFLNSLATSGGNLFLLATFVIVLLISSVAIMVSFGPASPSAIVVVGAFNMFVGALASSLRGSKVSTPPPGMAQTVSTTSTTSTVPPPVNP